VKLRISDAAFDEMRTIHDHYETERPGLGSEFTRALGLALRDITEFPQAWSSLRKGSRRRNLRRFPYGVYYFIKDDLITIEAIAHHGRRPYYWRRRS